MVEVGEAVTRRDLRDQPTPLIQNLTFVCVQVHRLVLLYIVDVHVRERCGEVFGHDEALVEIGCVADLLNKVFRDHLSRGVMDGVFAKHLRLERPILHDLRGEFDEITLRTPQSLIGRFSEQVVEGVAEFVEERFGLVEREQGWVLITDRAREVARDIHDRICDLLTVAELPSLQRTAPCAASFHARTWVHIHINNG